MPLRTRLAAALSTRNQISAATASAVAVCSRTERTARLERLAVPFPARAAGTLARPLASGGLLEGRGVEHAAVAPQLVEPAVELQRRVLADIAVPDLLVVPELLDDL